MTKDFGSTRYNTQRKIVRMRTKDLMSWAAIGQALGMAPRTARRIFQERVGEGQHHDHLPNKGGRFPSGKVTKEDTLIVWKTTAKVPVLDGTGHVNSWDKYEVA